MLMKNMTIERTVNAPRSAVWGVLADYPNIASWNSGVKTSVATSAETTGVGAMVGLIGNWALSPDGRRGVIPSLLGGGLSNIDELYDKGAAEVEKRVFCDRFDTPIVRNRLGDSAGVIGAAWIGI